MLEPTESELKAFVGRRIETYLKAWFPPDPSVQSVTGDFKVAAFCGSVLWLAYRKLFAFAAVFIGVFVVMQIAMAMLVVLLTMAFPGFLSSPSTFGRVVSGIPLVAWLAVALFCGTYGNLWYQGFVYKSVDQVRQLALPESAAIAQLEKQGGTSGLAAIGFAGVIVVVQFLLVGVFQKVLAAIAPYVS